MALDDKNNIIEVCTFESVLAKYFIEHPELFKSLTDKIFAAIEHLITANSENASFNRLLFSVFSTLNDEYPGVSDMKSLRKSSSIVLFDTFFKHFTERVMTIPALILSACELHNSHTSSEKYLVNHSLFKSNDRQFLEKMRPANLFSVKNRGVVDFDPAKEEETQNLGILSTEDTPELLKDFFSSPHAPSRQYYQPKEDSLMALWLRKHFLPVISGASGGIGKTLSKLNLLIPLSKAEFNLIGILIASSTIALGHHSFFEVMRPVTFVTGELEMKKTLLEFYEQVIPEEVKRLPSYKEHIKNNSQLIEKFNFAHLQENLTEQLTPSMTL